MSSASIVRQARQTARNRRAARERELFSWAEGAHFKIEPSVAAKEFKAIRARGLLTPEAVVSRAASPKNPLHSEFTWDNAEAARLRRLDEARRLMGALVISYVREDAPPTPPMRYVIKIQPSPGERRGSSYGLTNHSTNTGVYVPFRQALEDPEDRQRVLQMALRDLRTFRHKYAPFDAELHEVFVAADRVLGV